jgi:hypothetical protein
MLVSSSLQIYQRISPSVKCLCLRPLGLQGEARIPAQALALAAILRELDDEIRETLLVADRKTTAAIIAAH